MRALFIQPSNRGLCEDPLFLTWCCCLTEKRLVVRHCFSSKREISPHCYLLWLSPTLRTLHASFLSHSPNSLSARFIITAQLPAVLNQSLTIMSKYGGSCQLSPYQTFKELLGRNHSKEGWRPLINTLVVEGTICQLYRLVVKEQIVGEQKSLGQLKDGWFMVCD